MLLLYVIKDFSNSYIFPKYLRLYDFAKFIILGLVI